MKFIFRLIVGVAIAHAGMMARMADPVHAEMRVSELRVLETQIGDATYYGGRFHGRRTASGRIFDKNRAVAAHRTLPFGTVVRVTDVRTGKIIQVVIVDRGPFGKNRREGAIIDLSAGAAKRLGILEVGQTRVKVEVILWGDDRYVREG